MRAALAIPLLLVACVKVPRGVEVQPEPVTATREGRNDVRIKLAETLIDAGDTVQARQVLDLAAKEGADPGELDLLRGRALAHEGLWTEAEGLLTKAEKELPHDARPWRAMGILQVDSKRIDDAIVSFQKAVAIDDSDAATWNNLGFALLAAKRTTEAADALGKAVTLDGSNPRYRTNLGFALAADGRDAEALAAFRGAGPEADAQSNLGLAYELGGDNAKAREHYEKALASDPSHKAAREALDRIDSASKETP